MSQMLSAIVENILETELLVEQLPPTATSSTLKARIEKAVRQCREIRQINERLLEINILENLSLEYTSSIKNHVEPDLKGLIKAMTNSVFRLDAKQAYEIVLTDYFKKKKTLLDSFLFLLSDLVSSVEFPLVGGVGKLIKQVDLEFAVDKTDTLEEILVKHLKETKLFDLTRFSQLNPKPELGRKRERTDEPVSQKNRRNKKKKGSKGQKGVNPSMFSV